MRSNNTLLELILTSVAFGLVAYFVLTCIGGI